MKPSLKQKSENMLKSQLTVRRVTSYNALSHQQSTRHALLIFGRNVGRRTCAPNEGLQTEVVVVDYYVIEEQCTRTVYMPKLHTSLNMFHLNISSERAFIEEAYFNVVFPVVFKSVASARF